MVKLLLEEMSGRDYRQLLAPNTDWDHNLRRHYKIRRGQSDNPKKELLYALHERGVTLATLKQDLLNICGITLGERSKRKRPSAKVAILVGNAEYHNWTSLSTPVFDCRKLAKILKRLGFIVITLENIEMDFFKTAYRELLDRIPKGAYVLFHFAGHGLEFNAVRYMIGVECPALETLTAVKNAVSENFLMKAALERKPELIVLLLDICRESPDRELDRKLYEELPPLEEYEIGNCNFVIGYSTSPYMPSFEKKIQRDPTDGEPAPVPESGASLYVEHLCKHLMKDIDLVEILKMTHDDIAKDSCNGLTIQKPQKSDNATSAFYLTTKSEANGENIAELLKAEVDRYRSSGISATVT